MKQNTNYVLAGILFLSLLFNIVNLLNSSADGLDNAARKLSSFGTELGKITKDHPITGDQKKQIGELARIAVPISRNIQKNAVMTHGINSHNQKPVVLRSDTGQELDSCGSVEVRENVIQGCDITIEDTNEALINAINASEPIDATLNGKKAKFVINVTATYKGSVCETYFVGGKMYKICWDIPNF